MTSSKRPGRQLFLLFICCAWVSVLLAPPLVSALEPASAGSSRRAATFEIADLDGDGFVTAREARMVRGPAAQLGRADANRDGRLDKVEYARALAMADEGRR